MKSAKGVTLIDVLIVVAVAGVIAAVILPAMSRAFIAANESATIGDIRTVIDAQTGYRSANAGFYDGRLVCLAAPAAPGCIPSYPANGPTFLDSALASLMAKNGYNRSFAARQISPVPANASPSSTDAYRYDATPTVIGVTGVRGFAGDASGRVCFTPDGAPVSPGPDPVTLPPGCAVVP